MSKPKIEDLINTSDSTEMAILFKSKNTDTDGSIKSGFYAGVNDSQDTDDYDIPSGGDDYLLYAFTAAGSARIYYSNKSDGTCKLHYGDQQETIDSDAKVELHVAEDGSLSIST